MDVSKRGEEVLVSGSDDGYIGVSVAYRIGYCETDLTAAIDLGH